MDEALDQLTYALCAAAWRAACWLAALAWLALRWLGAALWRRVPERRRERLIGAGLDAYGGLADIRRAAVMRLSAALTVERDPWGYGRAVAPLRGVRGYTGFAIAGAPSAREARALAWFYRWHDDPGDDDWRRFLARFGLPAMPASWAVELHGGPGVETVRVSGARLRANAERGWRRLAHERGQATVREVSGPTPIGGLSLRQMAADLGLGGEPARG